MTDKPRKDSDVLPAGGILEKEIANKIEFFTFKMAQESYRKGLIDLDERLYSYEDLREVISETLASVRAEIKQFDIKYFRCPYCEDDKGIFEGCDNIDKHFTILKKALLKELGIKNREGE